MKPRTQESRTKVIFLDWFNNFLSVTRCAEYWGISEASLNRIITYWRKNQ